MMEKPIRIRHVGDQRTSLPGCTSSIWLMEGNEREPEDPRQSCGRWRALDQHLASLLEAKRSRVLASLAATHRFPDGPERCRACHPGPSLAHSMSSRTTVVLLDDEGLALPGPSLPRP